MSDEGFETEVDITPDPVDTGSSDWEGEMDSLLDDTPETAQLESELAENHNDFDGYVPSEDIEIPEESEITEDAEISEDIEIPEEVEIPEAVEIPEDVEIPDDVEITNDAINETNEETVKMMDRVDGASGENDSDIDLEGAYEAMKNSEIQIIKEDGTVDSLENIQNELENKNEDVRPDKEQYEAKKNSEIQIIKEDGTVDSLENIQNELESETSVSEPDAEFYEALNNSEIPIIKEDGTVDSLENIQNELENKNEVMRPDAEPYNVLDDIIQEDGTNVEEINSDTISYDENEGYHLEKVLTYSGGTVTKHNNIEEQLADLNEGYKNEAEVYEEVFNLIANDEGMSNSEKIGQLNALKQETLNLKKEYDQNVSDITGKETDVTGEIYSIPDGGSDTENIIGIDDMLNAKQEPLINNSEIQEIAKTENIKEWLGDINPNYDPLDLSSAYDNNCGSCALAVEQRLDGNTDVVATAENIDTPEEMNKITEMKQIPMSPYEIKEYLISQGAGAHGIVGIDRAEGPGHWFNAYYDGEKVLAIDGQTGKIQDWPPDYGDVTNWDISVRKDQKIG